MFESTVRSLNVKEQRALRKRLASLRRSWTRVRHRLIAVTLGLCAVMATLTVLTWESWASSVVFWAVTSLALGAWVWIGESVRRRKRVQQLESALRGGEVCETRIQALAVAEFEEQEDEGACYAIDVGAGRILFISGQEFYASPTFPNSDFSLIEVHDAQGGIVEFFIEKRGRRLEVSRTISAEAKKRLRIPEHLESAEGQLSEIERVLASPEA